MRTRKCKAHSIRMLLMSLLYSQAFQLIAVSATDDGKRQVNTNNERRVVIAGTTSREGCLHSGSGVLFLINSRRGITNPAEVASGQPPRFGNEQRSLQVSRWSFEGDKFYDETRLFDDMKRTVLHTVVMCNGEQGGYYEIHPAEDSYNWSGFGQLLDLGDARLKRGSSAAGELQVQTRKHDSPTYSVMLAQPESSLIGEESLHGLSCFKFRVGPSKLSDLEGTWWIAPDRGFLVLKEEDWTTRDTYRLRLIRWVDKMAKVQNIWLPTVIRTALFAEFKNGRRVPLGGTERRMENLEINQPIGDDVFRIEFPLGMEVVRPDGSQFTSGGNIREDATHLRDSTFWQKLFDEAFRE